MMAARLAGVALLALGVGAQAGQEDARAWVQRMNHAVVNSNYDGVFKQRLGERSQVYGIIHRMKDGEMIERVISTDGSRYEQKRKGSRWAEFRPESKMVIVATRNRSFGYIPALNGLDRLAANHYDITDKGQARLLGRDVQVIHLDPKDNLRYGYRFWLDRQSALPLKFQRTTFDGTVLKEIAFIRPPGLPETISDDQLKVEVDAKGFRWVSWDQFTPMHNPKLSRAYVPSAALLPAGYRVRTFSTPEQEASAGAPRARFYVSDGVSWVDVYVSPAGDADNKTSSSINGSIVTFTMRRDDVQVVVVGETPQETARAIAESVRPE